MYVIERQGGREGGRVCEQEKEKAKVREEEYSQRRRKGEEVGRTAIRCMHRKLAEE